MKLKNKGYIYLFRRRKDNSACYVGQHNGSNKDYFTNSYILCKELEERGKDQFWIYYSKEIIHNNIINKNELNKLEKKYIEKYHTYRWENLNGYNLTKGGNGGDTFSANINKEQIRKNHIQASKQRHIDGKSKTWKEILESNQNLIDKKNEGIRKRWCNEEFSIGQIKKMQEGKIRSNKYVSESRKRTLNSIKHKTKRSNHAKNLWSSIDYRMKRGCKTIYVYTINNVLFTIFNSHNSCAKFFKTSIPFIRKSFLDQKELFKNEFYLRSNAITC